MKRLYLVTLVAFWVGVAVFGGLAWHAPDAPSRGPAVAVGGSASSPSPAASAARLWTRTELARHARRDDCWLLIDGRVYDVTAYLPRHPADDGLIDPWCGRDATEAYRTKLLGKPHSTRADALLAKDLIGVLDDAAR